ncbi:hypothetical protein AMJ44_15850 [candidate division WOR-1 bacterium DG_54_3]|uniref:Uncharacterized protein n=1 Tax=candidate division WOR-1 bacterium DG_54_3 TaxID=1703775 RepID=A0A0S7XIH8_UNCSA|nr:MAG: hypothetical protein AMJ44_15850 [candidate division WOR-1 bacterium DG_54_3]
MNPDSGTQQKVARINRNRWPECSGFSDRNKSESVTGMGRNLQEIPISLRDKIRAFHLKMNTNQ